MIDWKKMIDWPSTPGIYDTYVQTLFPNKNRTECVNCRVADWATVFGRDMAGLSQWAGKGTEQNHLGLIL